MIDTPVKNLQAGTLPALAEMQALHQWCCYKKEKRAETDEKPTKVPYHPNNYKASSKKPATWVSYHSAARAYRLTNTFSGIGFFFNGQVYSGIDIDDCVDEHGNIADWALAIIRMFDSYTEFSTSGTGVHIVVRGLLQTKTLDEDGREYIKGSKNNPQVGDVPEKKLELYSERRFFVVTGKHVPGTPTAINERQDQLLSILNTFFLEPKAEKQRKFYEKSPKLPDNYQPSEIPQNDNELWQIIFREKNNGTRWERIYYGDASDYMGDDGSADESAADAAIAAKLVFYTQHDAARVERMMWQTSLTRDKWTSHPTYLKLTIDNAMRIVYDDYDPNYHKGRSPGSSQDAADRPDPEESEPIESFNDIKEEVAAILEHKESQETDIEAFYACAKKCGGLDDEEQSILEGIIKSKIGKKKELSWSRFKKLMDGAIKDYKAKNANKEERELYAKTGAGMVYFTNEAAVPISNFGAEIVADVKIDDGAEQTRFYKLQAELSGRQFNFEVAAKDLASCTWVDEHLGARARVTTGQSMKSHLINAIKSVSNAEELFHYAHTGWRRIDGTMVFLHADGSLGPVGPIEELDKNDRTHLFFSSESACRASLENEKYCLGPVGPVGPQNRQASVKLTGSLTNYNLSCEQSNLQQAIRSSLRILDLAKDEITVPLYCAVWRAPLGDIDFGVHLAGKTGYGKSELVALAQQHYGASMRAKKLPGSWESTENSLEMLLFQAKDVVIVVDDFKPKGGKNEQARLHAKADRVFRQIGNGSARGRLDATLNQRVVRSPRCLLISTGEDVPRGQSLKARCINVTMDERITVDESARKLSEAQRDARQGVFVQALSGYIEWLAPRIGAIQSQMSSIVAEERDRLNVGGHARAGENSANLLLGMKCFLQYACEMEAITPSVAADYLQRSESALIRLAGEAANADSHDNPTEQWRRLIVEALASKRAHLTGTDEKNPGLEYGWKVRTREVEKDGAIVEEETFEGGGDRIGWIDGDDIYLLPGVAYKAANDMGNRIGDNVTTSDYELRKMLKQDGLLASTSLDKSRARITVRPRQISGRPEVLHVKKKIFFPDDTLHFSPDPADPADPQPSKTASEADAGVGPVEAENRAGSGHFQDPDRTQQKPAQQETDSHHTKPLIDVSVIPIEYRDLFIEYSQKVDSLRVDTPTWQAPDSGYKNTVFEKDAHKKYTWSLLRSGDTAKEKAAIEAMQRTMGIYESR